MFAELYCIYTERRQPFLRIGVIRAPMRPDPGGEQPLFVDCLRALVLRPQVLLESERLGEVDDRRPLLRADLQPELREEGLASRCDLVQVDEDLLG